MCLGTQIYVIQFKKKDNLKINVIDLDMLLDGIRPIAPGTDEGLSPGKWRDLPG